MEPLGDGSGHQPEWAGPVREIAPDVFILLLRHYLFKLTKLPKPWVFLSLCYAQVSLSGSYDMIIQHDEPLSLLDYQFSRAVAP